MSKVITVLGFLLFAVTAVFGAQRAANAYKTHKLTTTSVMISCNDEREPKVSHWENTTLIIVTCQPTASPTAKMDREVEKQVDKQFPQN